MRKDYGPKAALYPMPVFVLGTYDDDGTPNAMTAAWGGISNDTEISICISTDHQTTLNIEKRKAFTVSIGDAAHAAECDYLGMVSGKEVKDKVAKAGLTTTKSERVDAPIFNEFAVCVECRVKSWDPATERLVGEIVNLSIDESALTDGKPDIFKIRPISYDAINHTYNIISVSVGNAWKDGLRFKD